MLSITDLKTGVTVTIDGQPYEVVKYQHSKMGRGGAVMRTTMKNLLTGNNIERTFHGDDKIESAELTRQKAQYLYRDGDNYVFMDTTSFEQFHMPASVVGFAGNFIKDGLEVELIVFQERPINIQLPTKMALKIVEAEPAVKGDTATNALKNAKLETGLEVRVPMFVNTNDTIIVDTRDGTYVERAK